MNRSIELHKTVRLCILADIDRKTAKVIDVMAEIGKLIENGRKLSKQIDAAEQQGLDGFDHETYMQEKAKKGKK
jgi:hypothetical protein